LEYIQVKASYRSIQAKHTVTDLFFQLDFCIEHLKIPFEEYLKKPKAVRKLYYYYFLLRNYYEQEIAEAKQKELKQQELQQRYKIITKKTR
jgi:hypothetical protein